MVPAYFDEQGRPKVKIEVSGLWKRGFIDALFDTGHSGELSLPVSILIEIGAPVKGVQLVEYADGRKAYELVFPVLVFIEGEQRTVSATLTGSSQPIAGTQLFNNHKVLIDFIRKQLVIVNDNDASMQGNP
ncbi:hypothetical protein A2661_02830 [Candidatus Giovannonibacteria bacterium RIFCSPHIGHO2_01_FULL_45_24]|uniref:Clan AA aspartic protease n=1 Tax=Candidatus Giovannonibacteria bacterium RIFCSPLOWO2_01_FULL_46_32 TaxID=1798353 RepID=A0A1F5XG96_9BACT|nr:MAG: hypothetical protein A2661_02830 [Candidatus Giovannonibacteria bacterium RIFCSPHIGHO2_01_FULL_45_24]OGF86948.1 MAG: hypothetical protein A3B19_00745 [Candidatus Giovannonibacteria bacterium RIFCSPLOWO2_01_FULL_46_32]